ncbi:hypothetical protein ACTFIZ_002291 [Dictyostelium cf. discoideum]
MSTTVNNNEASSSQSDDETSNDVDVPTEYQLSDTLLCQYKHMVNNQGLLVEEECILKKEEISEMNKVFNFPSNFSVNVAPFGTPDGISVLSNVKNNDTDLLIVVGVMADLITSMDQQVMLHQVATIPSLQAAPTTFFRRTRSKLTSRWTSKSFKMEGIKNIPSMVKQGYYMVKLDIKKAYLHVLVDPQYRDLFRFVWQGAHYRWKTMPFGLSTATHLYFEC